MNSETLHNLQIRVANLAVGPSSVRNQGASGVVKAAREALKTIDLYRFKSAGKKKFRSLLDEETEMVRSRFPKGARNWGAARKCVNAFLRDVLYNRYLGDAYRFPRFEAELEVPLDRDVGTRLYAEPEGADLPRWQTIKGLTLEVSDQYQQAARDVARRMNLHRVHLDLLYWSRSQE